MKDYSTALLDFSKAIELQPENGVNYYRRALCHLALGNKENYYDDVKTALHLINTKYEQNKESDIAFMIALCSLASGEADKAQRLYEETISQCFDKNDLSNALKNLEEFTDLLGKTEKTEFVVKSLNEASAKLS
jgi:tetratricopeptide (TPR) repeat protein